MYTMHGKVVYTVGGLIIVHSKLQYYRSNVISKLTFTVSENGVESAWSDQLPGILPYCPVEIFRKLKDFKFKGKGLQYYLFGP